MQRDERSTIYVIRATSPLYKLDAPLRSGSHRDHIGICRDLARGPPGGHIAGRLSAVRPNSAPGLHVGTADALAIAVPKPRTISHSWTAPRRSKSGRYSSDG